MNKRVVDLIVEKREGAEHTKEEIGQLVAGYVSGSVADYQMSAWLMAVMFQGLSDNETLYLTQAMVQSGTVFDWSDVPGPFVDKHSTGGVGDKTSLAVVPLLAANGIHVAKLSGRGLGNTGGTLDKLDSIPGYQSGLSVEAIKKQIKAVGACLCAQTEELVPADKKLYALRDASGTVQSIPLIAASIMSKKIAMGCKAIVLDVKVGSGALMTTYEGSRQLAEAMLRIGEGFGRDLVIVLTDMDTPLGKAVGNRLEVQETIELLQGDPEVDSRLNDVFTDLTVAGLLVTQVCKDREEAADRVRETITSGRAWAKFEEIIAAQGGSLERFNAHNVEPNGSVTAPHDGYVASIRADVVGLSAMRLGAGRDKKEDTIDLDAGITINVPLGKYVRKGDVLAELYSSSEKKSDSVAQSLLEAWTISEEEPGLRGVVIDSMRSHGVSV